MRAPFAALLVPVALLLPPAALAEKIRCVDDARLAENVKAVMAGEKHGKLKWGSNAPMFCVARSKMLTDEEKMIAARAIVKSGTDLDYNDSTGQTVLHVVAQFGPAELAQFLIDQGVDPDAPNVTGFSPFQLAMQSGNAALAEVFAAHGRYVDSRNDSGSTSLYDAAKRGDLTTVRLLMARGADAGASAKSALAGAALTGQESVVRYFVEEAKLPVDVRSSDGETALMTAAAANQLKMAQLLIEAYKADPQLSSPRGFTSLSLAATAGHLDMIRYLLAHGATDGASRPSALSAAALAYRMDALTLLMDNGADLGPGSESAPGVLFWAGVRGEDQILRALVARGAAMSALPPDTGPLVRALTNKHYGLGLLARGRYAEAAPYLRESIAQYDSLVSTLSSRSQELQKTARREKLKSDLFTAFAIAFGQFAAQYQQTQRDQTMAQVQALGYANQHGTGVAGYYDYLDYYARESAKLPTDNRDVSSVTGSGPTAWQRRSVAARSESEALTVIVAQYQEASRAIAVALACAGAAAEPEAAAPTGHCL